jgi:membrane protein DedA with SNARE-associated domain
VIDGVATCMDNWVAEVLQMFGYVGLALLMFLENVFPPIPSELIMPLAGYLVAKGEMSFVGVVAAGTAGSVAGALPLYAAGRRLGKRRVIEWADRHGRWLTLSGKHVQGAIDWLDRRGTTIILLGRLIPGVRSLISVPAGIARVHLALFLLLTTIGSAIWSSLLAGAGLALGSAFERVDAVVGLVSNGILVAVVVVYVWRVAKGKGCRRH